MSKNLYHELMSQTISTASRVQSGSDANTLGCGLAYQQAGSSAGTRRATLASRIERIVWKLARWCGF